MKTLNFQKPRLTIVALTLALMTGSIFAQEPTSTTANTGQPEVASQSKPQLSYGVPEVVQLSKANVSDGTIINYIRNSGNNYGLNAAQIIYLRQQGVSDAVINAMLDQHLQTARPAATRTASQPADSTTYNTQISATTAQPTVTYVQTVPTSSVYIIPDTQTYQYNNWLYYHSPSYCYYPSYGYCWPGSSVSVTYIGRRGWVGYRGGYHSTFYRSGFHSGWHGGGFRSGIHSSGWHRR